jgi:predicted PurR-regulated permease PerM
MAPQPPSSGGEVALPVTRDSDVTVSIGPSRGRARIFIAVLAAGILYGAAPYLTGLIGAAVLYVVSVPVYRRLAPRIGPSWAALVVTVGVAMLLVLPTIWIVVVVLEQAPAAFTAVVQSDSFARLSVLRVGPLDVGSQLSRAGELAAAWASRQALALVGSITRAVLNLLIATVGLYYLFKSATGLWRRVRPMIPFSTAGADALGERFGLVTQATLLGIVATGIAQGVTVGLAFWVVGLPNPIVWGSATAVASIFPLVGSALVWGPGVLVLIVGHRYGAAIALGLIGGLITSNIDNVIRPLVYSRVSGVHPMATLLGAFAGVGLLGLPGLLMGPLAISYLFELLDLYDEEYGTVRR